MNWFLYDNGLRHERVKKQTISIGWNPWKLSLKTALQSMFLNFIFCKQYPAGDYMIKLTIETLTRTRCEICSNLTIKTPKRCQWRLSSVFIVKFEYISHLVLVFLLLTLNKYRPAEQRLLNVIVKIIKKAYNEIFGATTFQGPFCFVFFFNYFLLLGSQIQP